VEEEAVAGLVVTDEPYDPEEEVEALAGLLVADESY
jgi:hypothetical protein